MNTKEYLENIKETLSKIKLNYKNEIINLILIYDSGNTKRIKNLSEIDLQLKPTLKIINRTQHLKLIFPSGIHTNEFFPETTDPHTIISQFNKIKKDLGFDCCPIILEIFRKDNIIEDVQSYTMETFLEDFQTVLETQ